MQKVLVIGCPGSGKSCFARTLHAKTGLPLFHLDLLYWNADRTTVPKDVFLDRLHGALGQDAWIIDGNYLSTLELRLQACDTVFFPDLPSETCLDGIRRRRGVPRPDLPWIEPAEDIDAEFLAFVQNFQADARPQVLALLERYAGKHVVAFHSHAELDAFLNSMHA